MAINIFDKFGIKEVANVYFQALADEPRAGIYEGDIVLFLDSLKVSTIEQTAETTAAQGGWGKKGIAPTLKNLSNCWKVLKPIY